MYLIQIFKILQKPDVAGHSPACPVGTG